MHSVTITPGEPLSRLSTRQDDDSHRLSTNNPSTDITLEIPADSPTVDPTEEYEPEMRRKKSIMPTRHQALKKNLVVSKLEYHMGKPVLTDPINVYCRNFVWGCGYHILNQSGRYLVRELDQN